MTYKNLLFVAGGCLLFLAACQSPKDQIVRKWQVDSVESPMRDSMMKVQEHSIDTMKTVDSGMVMYFGTSNIDSIKTAIKKQMAAMKQEQEEGPKKISMTFRKDGIMLQEGPGRSDSAKWVLNGKDSIVISPIVPAGAPAGMSQPPETFIIEKISSSVLRVKIGSGKQLTYVNFKAAGDTKPEEKKPEDKKPEEKK